MDGAQCTATSANPLAKSTFLVFFLARKVKTKERKGREDRNQIVKHGMFI